MFTVTLFWMAFLVTFLFVLAFMLKAVSSIINSSLTTIAAIIFIPGAILLLSILLELFAEICAMFFEKGFWAGIGFTILSVVIIGFVVEFFGSIAIIILGIVAAIAEIILGIVEFVLNISIPFFENLYAEGLSKIIIKLEDN